MAIEQIALDDNAGFKAAQVTNASQNTDASCKTEWISDICQEIMCFLDEAKDKKNEDNLKKEEILDQKQEKDNQENKDIWLESKALNASYDRAPCSSPVDPVNFALNQLFMEEKFVEETMQKMAILRDRYTNNVAKPHGNHASNEDKRAYICVSKNPADCFSMLCRAKGRHVLEHPESWKIKTTSAEAFESNGFPSSVLNMDDLGFVRGNQVDSWKMVNILNQFQFTG